MRTVREITAELAASGLTAEQMALVTELAMSSMGTSQSKHAQAQARYYARKKERSVLISADQYDQNDQHVSSPSSPSASLPFPLPPITPISLTLTSPPSSLSLSDDRQKREAKFEEFKRAYPKRKGGNPWPPAKKLFDRAVLAGSDPDQIIAAVSSGLGYDRDKVGTEYIPQARKWLHDECWRDLLAHPPPNDRPAYMTPPPGFTRSFEEELAFYNQINRGEKPSDAAEGAEIRGDSGRQKPRPH
jgi:hypothetical protein